MPDEWKDRALKAEERVEELTRLGTHHVTRLLDCVQKGYGTHPWVESAKEWRDANDPERREATDGLREKVWKGIVDRTAPEIRDAIMGCPGCEVLVHAVKRERARVLELESVGHLRQPSWGDLKNVRPRAWVGVALLLSLLFFYPLIPGYEPISLWDLAATPVAVLALWLILHSGKGQR